MPHLYQVVDVVIVLLPQCDGVVVDSRKPPSHNPGIESHQFPFRKFLVVFRAKVRCHLQSYDE